MTYCLGSVYFAYSWSIEISQVSLSGQDSATVDASPWYDYKAYSFFGEAIWLCSYMREVSALLFIRIGPCESLNRREEQ